MYFVNFDTELKLLMQRISASIVIQQVCEISGMVKIGELVFLEALRKLMG